MTDPPRAFWDDLQADLADPEFREAFITASIGYRCADRIYGYPVEPEGDDDECE